MTDKELVEVIDSVGAILLDFDIKGSQSLAFGAVIKRLNAVRDELAKRVESETNES